MKPVFSQEPRDFRLEDVDNDWPDVVVLTGGCLYSQLDLDAAIAAERERCAKLCEYHDKDCAAEGREHNAIEIAAAIRNQEKE